MFRFYAQAIEGEIAYFSPEDQHHMTKSLRLNIGEEIVVIDNGMAWRARIVDQSVGLAAELIDPWAINSYPWQLTLYQGLPKGEKLEWIIQKGTELGVNMIYPVEFCHSIAKWKDRKGQKLARYKKIAEAAGKQSGRLRLPEIKEAISFSKMLDQLDDYDVVYTCYENERGEDLVRALTKMPDDVQKLALIVGPEGGIDNDELKALTVKSQVVGMGPQILRTETAAIVGIASIFNECRKRGLV